MKNFKFVFFAFILIFISTTNCTAQSIASNSIIGETELELAKKWIKAYEDADWQNMRAVLADNSQAFNLGGNDMLNTNEHIDFWEQLRMTLNPKIIEKKWLIGEYDNDKKGIWIYHWGKNRNSHDNGKTVTIPYHLAILFVDQKIKEVHFYYDRLKIVESMNFDLGSPDDEY
ncbi:nuclear transport factor 2-like protein [Marinigracilibium pacificum]|uniref:SnoaL-like domain-containing protein n=1 Tax=Marinigracilibium pacificum TaxID=2729599 RepID=A0A848IY97_9BACT|nr:hypothetical protein [Marinigracilibium pacificum]NMM48255.1 hypothetical protein [Marinigracilibium pacificum]